MAEQKMHRSVLNDLIRPLRATSFQDKGLWAVVQFMGVSERCIILYFNNYLVIIMYIQQLLHLQSTCGIMILEQNYKIV